MILKNADLWGRIVDIKMENGIFTKIAEKIDGFGIDVEGRRVIPGLIDTHIHGCNGYDTLGGNFAPMCDFLAKKGTTAWMPTLVTTDFETMKSVTAEIPKCRGAQILGYHLEGPYISKEYKGAHNERLIKAADWDELKVLKNIKLITIAPEVENAISVIGKCDFSVSLGHTGCDFDMAVRAFEAGAESITHTFNAMTPIHHRKPGVIGAAVYKNSYAEIITDGFHVHPAAVLMVFKMFGDKTIIVSDALECTGMPDGEYYLNKQKFTMKNFTARYEDGTIVGGTHTLLQCVKLAESFGIPFETAVKAASEVPARRFGLNKGKIEVGYDADLVILDENRDVEITVVGGKFYD